MNHWRARCIERCTPGSEGGCPEKARTRGTSPDSPPCPYEITFAVEFRAVRRDNGMALQAELAEELRALIRSDYTWRSVPRRSRRTHADRQRRPSPDWPGHTGRPKPGS